MSTIRLSILAFILSLLTLYVLAYNSQNGDGGTIGLMFGVYFGPILICIAFYVLFIKMLQYISSLKLKITLSFIPLLMFLAVASGILLRTHPYSYAVSFVGIVSSISIGIANFIWSIYLN